MGREEGWMEDSSLVESEGRQFELGSRELSFQGNECRWLEGESCRLRDGR